MKLRRAMAAAAATAVIAPVALLAAPAAYATDETTPSPSASVSESAPETSPSPSVSESTPEAPPSPSASVSESAPETSPSPSASASESSPAPSASEPEESESPDPEPSVCEDTKVDVSISGLPGKIAAGSGWHKFSLNVANNSDSTLNDLDFFAGASPDKNGEELFTSKQVQLQAWDPQDKIWVDLNEGGLAVGYVGYTDELEPEYEVNIPLRLNVKPSAPVGAGFSLGATIYGDSDGECVGFGDVSYKFQIVSAGTDTDGTKPQEGGKAPVTDEKPSGDTPEVTGSLAETGSSSALPMISLVGGAAVVAGAGAIFVVRRRKAGVQA
ncbi:MULTISPECIES: LAETG motif-containing sortase-dependent surface protein [Streptomyces]|uniref:LAETG motif-containing sortase-dependent surface protein n=1 Tax=Streptomyces TaxID=1883 RepID=UPI0004CD3791|nr:MULTISPECIES: LAETG motif-containing sortase-dependent surface protein [Streptomyces]